MPEAYVVQTGYSARREPDYFQDLSSSVTGRIWQVDVYRDLARVAELLGCTTIVDVGCGNGEKLAPLAGSFELIGIDFGANIEHCRRTYGFGRWLEDDFGKAGALPIDDEDLHGAAIVCADVIEHIPDPQPLVARLVAALSHAEVLLISTPDRALVYGDAHRGPPRNPAHVREWTIRELSAYLRRQGLEHGSVGLSRPHDHTLRMETILAGYVRDASRLRELEDILIDQPDPIYQPDPPTAIERVKEALSRARITLRQPMPPA